MADAAEPKNPLITLRRFNNALSLIVALLAIYIVAAPFLPEIGWWLLHHGGNQTVSLQQVYKSTSPIPKDDRLVVARMGLNTAIHSGSGPWELNKGVWLIPKTSTPDKGSNTVMAGHRFTYKNPQGIFYFLNKIKLSDLIIVDWKGKEYIYKVAAIKTVPPTALYIQDHSTKPMLTLFTCTPLWTSRERLVVQAGLIGERT